MQAAQRQNDRAWGEGMLQGFLFTLAAGIAFAALALHGMALFVAFDGAMWRAMRARALQARLEVFRKSNERGSTWTFVNA